PVPCRSLGDRVILPGRRPEPAAIVARTAPDGASEPFQRLVPRPDTDAGRRPAEPHSGTGHHRDHPRRRLRERGIGRRIARKAAGAPARPGRPLRTIECTASGPAAASATAANARPSAPPRPPPAP